MTTREVSGELSPILEYELRRRIGIATATLEWTLDDEAALSREQRRALRTVTREMTEVAGLLDGPGTLEDTLTHETRPTDGRILFATSHERALEPVAAHLERLGYDVSCVDSTASLHSTLEAADGETDAIACVAVDLLLEDGRLLDDQALLERVTARTVTGESVPFVPISLVVEDGLSIQGISALLSREAYPTAIRACLESLGAVTADERTTARNYTIGLLEGGALTDTQLEHRLESSGYAVTRFEPHSVDCSPHHIDVAFVSVDRLARDGENLLARIRQSHNGVRIPVVAVAAAPVFESLAIDDQWSVLPGARGFTHRYHQPTAFVGSMLHHRSF